MKKNTAYSRRKFLSTTAKGAAVITAAGVYSSCTLFKGESAGQIPRRILGKTGLKVSILSFGGGSQFLKNGNGVWEEMLEEAVKSGINLYDTSPDYTVVSRDGSKALSSEERFAEILPAYREKVFIASKINDRDASLTRKTVEQSLKSLKSDYIDILMLHSVDDRDDVLEVENGVYREMLKLKDEGLIKHIGISSMDSAQRSKDLLTHLDWDVALLALNPSLWGDYPGLAFPVAMEKEVGIIAMKVLRGIVGEAASAEELLQYSWDHPGVASSNVGHFGMETFKANIKMAADYGEGKAVAIAKEDLEARLAPYAGPHALCWARPGYKDGGIIV